MDDHENNKRIKLVTIGGRNYSVSNVPRGSRVNFNIPWKDLVDLIKKCRKDPSLEADTELARLAFKSRQRKYKTPGHAAAFFQDWDNGITAYEQGREDIRYYGAVITIPEQEFLKDPQKARRKYVYENLVLRVPGNIVPIEDDVPEVYEVKCMESGDLQVMMRLAYRIKPPEPSVVS